MFWLYFYYGLLPVETTVLAFIISTYSGNYIQIALKVSSLIFITEFINIDFEYQFRTAALVYHEVLKTLPASPIFSQLLWFTQPWYYHTVTLGRVLPSYAIHNTYRTRCRCGVLPDHNTPCQSVWLGIYHRTWHLIPDHGTYLCVVWKWKEVDQA